MLWLLAAVLFALWIAGLAFKVTSAVIHLALVAALILFVLGFVRGRGGATVP
jgi:hypothetical protein